MSRVPAGLPCSEACERNKEPILARLREHFAHLRWVLEIGSGTGQHAVHFASALPWLVWQTTERATEIAAVRAWLAAVPAPNLPPPLVLDVLGDWPAGSWDGVFSANTLHIMGWKGVQALFAGAGRVLEPGGVLAVYGPFNYGGTWTCPSNRDFDAFLRRRDPASGLRDVEAVHALAAGAGLQRVADHDMPANNRLLVWRRDSAGTAGPDPFDLQRFVDAQAPVIEDAIAELRAGRKRSHWMWFVFPQLAGLGSSAMAQRYAIGGREEARAYLAHPVLGARLVRCAEAILSVHGASAREILGSPDDLKLQSSMTLFSALPAAPAVFARVLERFYGGERCPATRARLGC
jgi:uncharacterized protein (DUF1810 family)